MSSMKLVRLTNGMLILIGLLFFKPLAYFVGIMMIFSGLTGVCIFKQKEETIPPFVINHLKTIL